MDLMQKIMNFAVPAFVFLTLPLLFIFNFLARLRRFLIPTEKLTGKVVLITGASSGIGEHLAYEYARKGARLAIVARREDRLRLVADKARVLGSPDVIPIQADVSKKEDCKRFIEEAVNHFGRLDHLVNNAGVIRFSLFEDCTQFSDFQKLMDTNFWGAVYCTHFAVPHLKKSKGKIIVISSVASWWPAPLLCFYNASKAAMTSFFETLRAEFGPDIGITIVSPCLIDSEMMDRSKMQNDIAVESCEKCAKAIVKNGCKGDRDLTEPSWARATFVMKIVCPQLLDWFTKLLAASEPSNKRA